MAEETRVQYAFFWGCQIPARLPFMEKATRLVLERVGVGFTDLAGFSCCPEKNLIGGWNHRAWLLTAARNLALAEAAGLDLLVACNGCYSTLKSALYELAADPQAAEWANQRLAALGLSLSGRVQVKHVLEVLHDEVGPGKIRLLLERPMSGLKIAVHPGCHLLRPSSAIHFDDPLQPTKYDALVEALGATSLPYQTKMLCCGQALGNAGEAEGSFALARKKLQEVQAAGADALSVMCPACFLQYDQKQYLAQRQGEALHVPVLTYVELLGLALGLEPEELGLKDHRVSPQDFLAAWEKHRRDFEAVKELVDLPSLRRCYACGACVADCPAAETVSSFQPNALIGQVLDGHIEELLRGQGIWMCLECHTCYELCPQKFGMEKVFRALKRLSLARGLGPAGLRGGVKTFVTTGRLGEPDAKARKKLGLADLPPPAGDDLAKLLGPLLEEE